MTGIRPGSVKICSLRSVEHARYVVDVRADLFGLIMVPGVRRYVAPDQARAIVETVKATAAGPAPFAVGVFRDETAAELNRIAREIGLDVVQLHGDEPPEYVAELELPAVKVITLTAASALAEADRRIAQYDAAPVRPIAYQLDAEKGEVSKSVDWNLAAELARRWPVMLAGGLTPENVAEAVATVRPHAVDVSGGIETDGGKDPDKIARFTANARDAFQALALNAAR